MVFLQIAVGFLLGTYLFSLAATAYCLWRYSFVPFKRSAEALKALEARQVAFEDWTRLEIGLRKAMAQSDPDLARQEGRLERARRLWSGDPNIIQKVPRGTA